MKSSETQNLLRLLGSAEMAALGLEIHQGSPTPESTALLNDYQKLYELIFNETVDTFSPEHLQKLNDSAIDLSCRELDILPSEIAQLSQLRKLYLAHNKFSTFPFELTLLSKLQKLVLSNNQLRRLPPTIGQCSAMQVLVLSDNQLKILPSEIGQLTELRELFLSNNKLRALPPEISQLSQLRTLHLGNNHLNRKQRAIITSWLPHCFISWR
ncbi:hypothetical protein BKI52_16600 [marine bacterium AO1-C]|nr:hypothetical protein BKI52_16600 [marine bacterium AO1-C]